MDITLEECNKHPSGLSWYKWNWPPAQTPEERKAVEKYLRKKEKKQVKDTIKEMETALF